MYSALLYNINVATSITSQGRALTSSMTMLWEMFLANNVQFGSLNEVMQFIDNIVQERKERKYIDYEILDENVRVEDCFAKVILTCGYRWVPTESEMEIIWKTINNLSQEDINRIYYKNNLYEFISNKKVFNIIKTPSNANAYSIWVDEADKDIIDVTLSGSYVAKKDGSATIHYNYKKD